MPTNLFRLFSFVVVFSVKSKGKAKSDFYYFISITYFFCYFCQFQVTSEKFMGRFPTKLFKSVLGQTRQSLIFEKVILLQLSWLASNIV